MALSKNDVAAAIAAARRFQTTAPAQRVEVFYTQVLNLTPSQVASYFAGNLLSIAISYLTEERERMLRDDCAIPDFVVFKDSNGKYWISGLDAYLATTAIGATLRARLLHHKKVRTAIRYVQNGHDLEALAAAIMSAEVAFGEATTGSGDQGIDAVGWRDLIVIDPCFSIGDLSKPDPLPGDRVFLFASSKAFTAGNGVPPKLIDPAHIRELVGGWMIQRSAVAKWQSLGVRLLSPVQMVLVTSYRLSENARAECQKLGVQVWGLPELVFLICRSAPAAVFSAANEISRPAFNRWWKAKDSTRLVAS